jgi:K+-transporting ATPase KdpF subunit
MTALYIVGAIVAIGLMVYLVIALLKPLSRSTTCSSNRNRRVE